MALVLHRVHVRVPLLVPPQTLAVFFALLLPNLEEEQRGREAGVTRAAPTRQIQLGSGETAPLLTQLET